MAALAVSRDKALIERLQDLEEKAEAADAYAQACSTAIQNNRADLVERALHVKWEDFLDFLHYFPTPKHAHLNRTCLLIAIVALSRQVLTPGFWHRTETVGVAATLFSFLLDQATTNGHGTIDTDTFKIKFDALCLELLTTAGLDRNNLNGSNIATTQLCAVLVSIITTGTLNLRNTRFAKWEKLQQGLTSAVTVLASVSSKVVGSTALPGAAIGSTVAASAGSIINAIITAGLGAMSGEEETKAVMGKSLRTWLQNLLAALGVNNYNVQGIQDATKQVSTIVGLFRTAVMHRLNSTASASDAADEHKEDQPPAEKKATPAEKHDAFKAEIVSSFLI